MLELQRALFAVALAAHDDEGSKKARHLKIATEFFGRPDLTVLGFESITATGLTIDFYDPLPAIRFGCIRHDDLLGLRWRLPESCTTKLGTSNHFGQGR